ncbi:MAG TPA: sulfite exporter TauE/SafE family protein [Stellaceae bacterium]|jgi:hypothetical protein|nr:sulfite exporter TauE/SafE family protein [Stellaceae bacterium]
MIATAWQLLIALGLGAASGMVGGLFGIGGGVIAIPVIGIIFTMPQQVAQGTSLVMVVPNVLLAFWRYRQRVGVDLRIAVTLGATATVAAYPVARLATGLNPHHLRLAFAGFLVALAAVVAYRTWRGARGAPQRKPLPWGWTAIVGLLGGMVSGLFGVGGAFIVPPALTTFFGVRQVEAQGLALALVCPGTIIALATYAGAGQVDWGLGIPLAIGGSAVISVGVAAAHRLPERPMRFAFCALSIAAAGLLVLHG